MGRISTIIAMACFAIAAFGLYIVKYTVQDIQRDVEIVRVENTKEHESLHLLNAEWAYLNRPERLRELSEAHLSLQPMDSRKVEDIRALPAAYNPSTGNLNPLPMLQPATDVKVR